MSALPVTLNHAGRAYKYQFDLELHRLYMYIPFPCLVYLSWRRGTKSIETKNKIYVKGGYQYMDLTERLSMISTCYHDNNTKNFNEKKSMVQVHIYINGAQKLGGCCHIDLSQVLNPVNIKYGIKKQLEIPLTRCPLKNSRLLLTLQATFLQEMVPEDRSFGSGVSSALNSSDWSLSIQRKNFYELGRYGSNKRLPVVEESKESSAGKKRIEQAYFTSPLLPIIYNMTYSNKVEYSYQLVPSQKDSACFKDTTNKLGSSMPKIKEDRLRLETYNTQLKVYVEYQSKKLTEYLNECSQLKQENRSMKFNTEKLHYQINILQTYLDRQRHEQNSHKVSQLAELQNTIASQMVDIETKLLEKEELRGHCYRMKIEIYSQKVRHEYLFRKMQIELNTSRRYLEQQRVEKQYYVARIKDDMHHLSVQLNYEKKKSSVLEANLKDLQQAGLNLTYKLKNRYELIQDRYNTLRLANMRHIDTERQFYLIQNQWKLEQQYYYRKNQYILARLHEKNTECETLNRINKELEARINGMESRIQNYIQKTSHYNNIKSSIIYKELSQVRSQLYSRSNQNRYLQARLADYYQRLHLERQMQEYTRRYLDSRYRNWRQQFYYANRNRIDSQKETYRLKNMSYHTRLELEKELDRTKSELKMLYSYHNRLKQEFYHVKTYSYLQTEDLNRKLQMRYAELANHLKSCSESKSELTHFARYNSQLRHEITQIRNESAVQIEQLNRIAEDLRMKNRSLCDYLQNLLIQNYEQAMRIRHLEESYLPRLSSTISQQKQEVDRFQLQFMELRSQESTQHHYFDRIMKENIQLQVSLKVREEEAKKSQFYYKELNVIKTKLDFYISRNREIYENFTTLERELKEKNRNLIVETYKTRILHEERLQFFNTLNYKSLALDIEHDKCEVLERNIKYLELKHEYLHEKCRYLYSSLKSANEIVKKYENRGLERRIRELEQRDVEKIATIEELTRNLCKSNDVVKDLHRAVYQKSRDLQQKYRQLLYFESKFNQMSDRRPIYSVQSVTYKKNLYRKNELLMSYLCLLKQKFEEQNRRPNDSELQQKILQLENQILRRYEKVKKLYRENSKLEEENIQLNIRIMKELTEIQKKQEGMKTDYTKSFGRVLSESHTALN